MRKYFGLLWLLIFLTPVELVFPDASVAAGTEVTGDAVSGTVVPELWAEGAYSSFHIISPAQTLIFSAAANGLLSIPFFTTLTGSANASVDLSYSQVSGYIRSIIGITTAASADFISVPGWSAELYGDFSYDTFTYGLFIKPKLIGYQEIGAARPGFSGGGEAGGLYTVTPSTILGLAVLGSWGLTGLGDTDYEYGAEGSLSWYLPVPVTAEFRAKWLRHGSSYRASLIDSGDPAAVDTYHLLHGAALIDAAVSQNLALRGSLPAELYLKDHPAVSGGALLSNKEKVLRLAPVISGSYLLGRGTSVQAALQGSFVLSNSDYQRSSLISLELGFRRRF